jgi:hypothetical protein
MCLQATHAHLLNNRKPLQIQLGCLQLPLFDEYNTPMKDSFKSNISLKHIPAQQTAAKNPTFSHTSKNVQLDIPECSKMSETFNKLEANRG